MTMLYGALKRMQASGGDLESLCREESGKYEDLRKAEQLTRGQDHLWRQVLETLEGWKCKTGAEHLKGEDAFARVREWFQKEVDHRSVAAEETKEALEHAFSFLEEAFGDSQEMVVFVTDLNSNRDSIQFLRENDCASYYRYNKGLLFDEQQEKILARMDEAEGKLSFGLKRE